MLTSGDQDSSVFGARSMRIDLHLHSHASGAATNWWVKSLGLGFETRESYTPPADAYEMVKQAGMDYVTLTDHETIEGALTLIDRPDFIVGEEVSAQFPEGGSAADVLVYGVTADHHIELQARRPNIYQLVEYLRENRLAHVLAHPVFELGDALDRAGIEKRIVLFPVWEFINGARPLQQNRLAREIALGIEPGDIRDLARKHDMTIPVHTRISGTGGSDDHCGAYGGTTWTVIPEVNSPSELLEVIRNGQVQPFGNHGSVSKMVHTGLRIAGSAVMAGDRTAAPAAKTQESDSGKSTQIEKLVASLPFLASLEDDQIRNMLAGQYERRATQALHGTGAGFPMLRLLNSIGSFVEGHLFVMPYLAMHGYFGRELQKTRVLRQELRPGETTPVRVGIFVDLMSEIHGVATMYRNMQILAEKPRLDQLEIVQCGGLPARGSVSLRAIAEMPMPLYEGRTLAVPSLIDVFDRIAESEYDVLHIATPGPLGLAALIAGTALGLPIVGGYHTEFGAYAQALSGDSIVGDMVETLVREFFERCTVVAVPSSSTGQSLIERGYRINRLNVLKNGVDPDLYSPDRRDDELWLSLGGHGLVLLYAGRVSKEKGLRRLADGYLALREKRSDVHLMIAGDGPYRKELEGLLGETATFTGFLSGLDLAKAYASSDIFVFPSTTDTLGRAVAEAQSSGLPAVVFGMGGPRECIRPDKSGFVIDPDDDAAFWAKVEFLLDDLVVRARMGREAREFAMTLTWDSVLDNLIALYREIAGLTAHPSLPIASEPDWLKRIVVSTSIDELDLSFAHATVATSAGLISQAEGQ